MSAEIFESTTTIMAPSEKSLEKFKQTDAVIAQMKKDYLSLSIKGLEDKEGFKKVYEARQAVKRTRVDLVKYSKSLKESALAWQRRVNDEQNRVVSELEEIEAYLQSEEDKIEAEKERIRQEKERQEQERIQKRIDALAQFGYGIDIAYLKGLDDESFEIVLRNAETEFRKEQQRKAEEERLRIEEEERVKAEREELERLRREAAEREAQEKSRLEAIEKEKRELQAQKLRARQQELLALGMTYNVTNASFEYRGSNESVTVQMMTDLIADDWHAVVDKLSASVAQVKEENKRKEEAEKARLEQEATERARRQWEQEQRERQEKEAAEKKRLEEEQAERQAKASDVDKFSELKSQILTIELPTVKSRWAKRTMAKIEESLAVINDLLNSAIDQPSTNKKTA